ncbi:DAK2 domain-containing protein [Xylanibacillus composti]|uniref:DhaL domain-containing protein n=1 Tax=Xylanibacillus composti TaxID=1572762 RepID=A0A8J4M0P5_9BACL|nr:DAK2 domain-containing protein [Xylanibacillus composti]MDT9725606.1 DAK2 domain-containing protein [Xylanibacillus composti]GIQ67699.1 hypothetical protein XYCOK13_05230 [Xylanibacillus composti]
MSKRFIDGSDFERMIAAAAARLKEQVQTVNNLNVFPVPDGDTGTNMNMTLQSGMEQLREKHSPDLGRSAEVLSKGLLMGARGNSGVILSQLFRGFAKGVNGQKEIDTVQFAQALQQGVDTAYQAVVKPVEGTILTVSREAAKHAVTIARRTDDFHAFLEEVTAKAKEALARTPDLLPVLKQVGVVDSGGQGLVYVYEGFLNGLKLSYADEPFAIASDAVRPEPKQEESAAPMEARGEAGEVAAQRYLDPDSIQYPYDMEFFIRLQSGNGSVQETFSEEKLRRQLSAIGDSVLVIADEEFAKVHVHTNVPGEVFNTAIRYGELTRFHLENMRDQHRRLIDEEEPGLSDGLEHAEETADLEQPMENLKPFGMVTVALGDGIASIFESLGVDVVLTGGQTMNPSTEDIVQAVEQVGAQTVFVLPNNSNIILAAQQAKQLAKANIIVIPTKTIPQGMAAALAFQEDLTAEEIERSMLPAIERVRSGQITNAVRNTQMEGVDIQEGDFIAILDGKIVVAEENLFDAGKQLLDRMLEHGDEVVTLLVGEDADAEMTERLSQYVQEQYPMAELEVLQGGQPLYPYLISVE